MKASHLLSFLGGAAFALAASLVAQTPNHVYELRVYHANAGKLDALNARFAGVTEKLFKEHKIHAIGYWTPQDPAQNELIYIVEHDSKDAATKNWAAFNDDPAWKKAKAESEKDGLLVDHIDSTYMNPTSYSRLK
jgi:hypothetical protein